MADSLSAPEDQSPAPDEAAQLEALNAVVDRAAPHGSLPEVAPDLVEEELEIDNIIPSYGYHMLPVVAIGGSAGSIPALREFFEVMPPDSGLAFVVILHLAPDYESTMAELLARTTTMAVKQAEDCMKVDANCVYVIPPGKTLHCVNSHLRLAPLEREHGKRVVVDLFFRSLADTHGPHATAIVLSGADGDGTIGLRRIKERGGLTIAQDPEEAETASMPRSAIATGMVDWVLQVKDMPARLVDYAARERRLQLPPEEGPQPAAAPRPAPDQAEAALREVLVFLRMRTGRDFTYYKRATILRRISRRMQVNAVEDLPGYLSFLRMHPGEAGALLKDLLISVTNFFRDRHAFETIEKRIAELFEGKEQSDTVRVWCAACATGEEAYSMAMLLLEHARTLDFPPAIQVFGCDLDEESIQVARAGVYPSAITADVSEERLRRWFVREHAGYRIRREVREVVLFAAHDLLKDAPFSRMDLISCRNLLIYLNRAAQDRAFDLFHFALRPHGLLFLGSSETIDDGSALFSISDKKHRIFARKSAPRFSLPVPTGPSAVVREAAQQASRERVPILPGPSFTLSASVPMPGDRGLLSEDLRRVSWGDLHFKLLERFGPPSILVDGNDEILHLSEHAGQFLKFVPGEPTMNLLRVIHPLLRSELRSALFRARQTGVPAEAPVVSLATDDGAELVHIHVLPAIDLAPDFLLVTFHAREQTTAELPPVAVAGEPEPLVRHLEFELEQMKGQLRNTIEQYEASTEELKASNEELQAMNEELRSATEELEASREELQSINEELTTVNVELKSKVDELGQANSDLQNLMGATAIATVFLDRDLRIMRFTPPAVDIFHLIEGDVGRPLTDLQHRLDYAELASDADRVLEKLAPIEREVRSCDGRNFLARMLPYRTIDDRIAGVVLALVDITESRRAQQALIESEERFRLFVTTTSDIVYRMSPDWSEMLFLADSRFLAPTKDTNNNWFEQYIPGPERAAVQAATEQAIEARSMFALEHRVIRVDGTIGWTSSRAVPMLGADGEIVEWLGTATDITERRAWQQDLEERNHDLTRFNTAAVGRELRMVELKKQINALAARLGIPLPYAAELEAGSEGTD